ncbi:hypothetical protein TNCV_574981 [Trichonephila clavipes]|nr:hypothetical protein TNCV_574981 [Trichonephila clavipes]
MRQRYLKAKALLPRNAGNGYRRIPFNGEKIFEVEESLKHQNDHIYSRLPISSGVATTVSMIWDPQTTRGQSCERINGRKKRYYSMIEIKVFESQQYFKFIKQTLKCDLEEQGEHRQEGTVRPETTAESESKLIVRSAFIASDMLYQRSDNNDHLQTTQRTGTKRKMERMHGEIKKKEGKGVENAVEEMTGRSFKNERGRGSEETNIKFREIYEDNNGIGMENGY